MGVLIVDKEKEKIVYVPMAADIIHPGHLNILRTAKKLGKVVVGLFSDEAIATYKRVPFMKYEMRKQILLALKDVDEVIEQKTKDYEENLRHLHPAYMVHGTDWQQGPLQKVRQKAIHIMQEWGGKIVEPEYTKGVSSSAIKKEQEKNGIFLKSKARTLQEQLMYQKNLVGIGVYDEFSIKLADYCKTKAKKEYASLWVEAEQLFSLQQKPTQKKLDISEYLSLLEHFNKLTKKPMIAYDISKDRIEDFSYLLCNFQKLDMAGMVILEDASFEQKLKIFTQNILVDDFKLFLKVLDTDKLNLSLVEKYRLVLGGLLLSKIDEVLTLKIEALGIPIIYLAEEKTILPKDYACKVYQNELFFYAKDSLTKQLTTLLD